MEQVKQNLETFTNVMEQMGYQVAVFAMNHQGQKMLSMVELDVKDLGFALFKFVCEYGSAEEACVMGTALMAAAAKMEADKEIDSELDDMLINLNLN